MKTILAFLLLTATALGVEITPTQIMGHGDPVPRFSAHGGNVLIVPAGETVTLPPDSTWDAIEVSGTLKVSREHDTACRFVHLTVLPGGTLDMGTAVDPVLGQVEFIVRDVPIDTVRDPYQFGNGIICHGAWLAHGRKLERAWATMPEVEAGATQVTVPADWRSGDSLLFPDTRQITATVRRESPVKITCLGGTTATLSKPLDFEHRAARSPGGAVRFLPYVVNATRNIVVRSENPQGTRGHTILLEEAHADVRYIALLGLGRTRAVNIDNTTADSGGNITHVGTNQIARYAWHWHHIHGHGGMEGHAHSGHLVGCYLNGDLIGKWGAVVHGSHDMHVADNVADSFAGAGFITEDGYEVRNVFERNLAMNIPGNGINGKYNLVAPRNIPGGEGAGFWIHGPKNIFRDNVACNCSVGFQMFFRNQVLGRQVPSVPGGEPDTLLDPRTATPIEFARNVGFSNTSSGYECWNNPRFSVSGLSVWNNRKAQVLVGDGEPGEFVAENLHALATDGASIGIATSAAYSDHLIVNGGTIEGCSSGVFEVEHEQTLKDVTIQCVIGMNYKFFRPARTTIDSVLFKPMGTNQYILYGMGQDWKPGDPIPQYYANWNNNSGQMFVVKNWQREGQDYLLFENQQRRDKPAWVGRGGNARLGVYFCPEAGLTMGQCWDKYGIAYGGGVFEPSEAIELDGLVHGVARSGLDPRLGPPRAVLVHPAQYETPAAGKLDLHFYLTGAPAGRFLYSLDGATPVLARAFFSDTHGVVRLSNVAAGTHAVKTWRVDAAGKPIPSSEMEFTYTVGP